MLPLVDTRGTAEAEGWRARVEGLSGPDKVEANLPSCLPRR